MRETQEVRDKVVLVGLNSPVLKRDENADEGSMEELADLLEMIRAVVTARGHTWDEVERIRAAKAQRNGAFEKKLYLIGVEKKSP